MLDYYNYLLIIVIISLNFSKTFVYLVIFHTLIFCNYLHCLIKYKKKKKQINKKFQNYFLFLLIKSEKTPLNTTKINTFDQL